MVVVPAGPYTPFQRDKSANSAEPALAASSRVAMFRLDFEPVTNARFLAFVQAHPEWRKSKVKPILADERYLKRWLSDLDPPVGASYEPVTNVSWFAAHAYCKALGIRLPTTEQWEYALADSGRGANAVRKRSLEWFAEPNGAHPPAITGSRNGYGVRATAAIRFVADRTHTRIVLSDQLQSRQLRTENPLVAAYFAVLGPPSDSDVCLWAL